MITDAKFPRDALCRDADPELWFPLDESNPDATARPRAICAACPVREACLAWALVHPATDGVWGGLTTAERRVLRATRQPVAVG